MGKNGCGADDGTLFRRSRHGVGKAESTSDLDRPDHWSSCEADLYQREAFLQEQSYRQETCCQRRAGLRARAGTAQELCSRVPPGRGDKVYASPASLLWSVDSRRVESGNVQTPGSPLAAIRGV